MNKTYYVTRGAGQVRRLDDFTLPWVDISTGHTEGFLDVMAFPDDIQKVIVVGRNRGIFQSIDSGANWTQAGGDYIGKLDNAQELLEVWIVDNSTSYIAAGTGGIVLKSIDGGLTYNTTSTYPTGSGTFDGDARVTSIHFISDLIGVVGVSLGGGTAVWKTTDGGSTWTQLNSAALVGSTGTGGIHLSTDEQTIVVQLSDGIYRSTDAGLSFVQVYDLTVDFPTGSGLHLTWVDDNTLWVSGNGGTFRQSTDAGATWTVIRSYSPTESSIIGAHFYDALNGFLGQNQQIHITDDAGLTTTLSEAIIAPNAIWSQTEIILSDPCYVLTDCAGIADPIYTGTDLSENLDQVITLADEEGNEIEGCWFVTENLTPCQDAQEVTIYRCYTDCDSCLPAPEPIRTAKPRVVLPHYTTGDCDPTIVEKAFCNHAEMIYRRVMARRFKLKNCCPKDDMAVEMEYLKIKHKLVEGKNPTPDPCNPMCMAFEGTIQPGYSATISYTDCYGEEQIDTLELTDTIQTISVCALNTNPPLVTLFDSESVEVDSFTLFSAEDCVVPEL